MGREEITRRKIGVESQLTVLELSAITEGRMFCLQPLKISFLRQYLLIKLILKLVGLLSLLIVLGCSESDEINCVSEESEAQIVQLQAEIMSLNPS